MPVLPFGVEATWAEVRALDVRPAGWGTTCRVVTPWGEGQLDLPLPGEFNVYNALAAIAAGGTLGAPLPAPWTPCVPHGCRGTDAACREWAALRRGGRLRPHPGRPDPGLSALRSQTQQAPDRRLRLRRRARPGQAPLDGTGRARLADYFVLTDEDPRLESREAILEEIARRGQGGGRSRGALRTRPGPGGQAVYALAEARPGDTVLLAGKGHERSIIRAQGDRLHTYPWDEREAARDALRRLGYG